MIFLFLSIGSIIVLLEYKKQKNLINPASLLILPYVVIIFFNNFFGYKLGFYKVGSDILGVYCLTFFFYFLGIKIASLNRKKICISENDNILKFSEYKMNQMVNFLLVIGIISLIKLFFLLQKYSFLEMEGMMGNGITGHLILLSNALLPIIFLYWSYNKKKFKYLIAIILILVATFFTFIKYNIIGCIVNIFIFTMLYKRSALKKAISILVFSVCFLFCLNYMVIFYSLDLNVTSEFYFKHFLTYILGSIINSNYIFIEDINTHLSIFFKLMIYFFAFPNMFFNKILGKVYFPSTIAKYEFYFISNNEKSNVLDAIGFLYPVYRPNIEIIVFYLFILVVGYTFYKLYINSMKRRYRFSTFISNLMTYFIFFSFFGTFYILPSPWEILIYSAFVPKLFLKSKKV